MGNAPPAGGYAKLDHTNTLPVWLQDAGYYTAHLGKYLNGYGRSDPTEVPPGYDEWRGSVDPTTYRFYDYTLNENGRLRTYGTYQTDLYARKAARIIRQRAPSEQPFFLWVAFLAPHSGGPREPDDPAGQATPVPAPRHRNDFDSEPLPRPPGFNERDVSDKPAGIRNRPLLGPGRIRQIRENYQQRLESLLAVDEAVARLVATLRGRRRAPEHAHHLHLGQRVLPRRAQSPPPGSCLHTSRPSVCRSSCAGPGSPPASA